MVSSQSCQSATKVLSGYLRRISPNKALLLVGSCKLCAGVFSVAQRFFYLSSGWMCQEAPCGAQIYFPQQTGRLLELWQSIACVTNIQQLVVLAIDSTGM